MQKQSGVTAQGKKDCMMVYVYNVCCYKLGSMSQCELKEVEENYLPGDESFKQFNKIMHRNQFRND